MMMTERIQNLCRLTLEGRMYVSPVSVEFDRQDDLLPAAEKEPKRICEYILAQEPMLTPYSAFTGFFRFDGSVVGDAFHRSGHRATQEGMAQFYLKPVDNLSTMEWQHATADYRKVLRLGIRGIIGEVDRSLAVHSLPQETAFLNGLKKVAKAMILWARKCADRAESFGKNAEDPSVRGNMTRLASALRRVPEYPP